MKEKLWVAVLAIIGVYYGSLAAKNIIDASDIITGLKHRLDTAEHDIRRIDMQTMINQDQIQQMMALKLNKLGK